MSANARLSYTRVFTLRCDSTTMHGRILITVDYLSDDTATRQLKATNDVRLVKFRRVVDRVRSALGPHPLGIRRTVQLPTRYLCRLRDCIHTR
jgi:hypothetical protein